jgi:DNA-binding CsgD family transcriptional regulator
MNDLADVHLTRAQIDCLLLVDQHLTSKEIAPILSVSRHTVDQRIRLAMRTLGVARRGDAARITAEAYGPLIGSDPSHQGPSAILPVAVDMEFPRTGIPLPFATRSRPRNEMSFAFRLIWIVVIGFGAALSAGIYLAGLESLSRLLAR